MLDSGDYNSRDPPPPEVFLHTDHKTYSGLNLFSPVSTFTLTCLINSWLLHPLHGSSLITLQIVSDAILPPTWLLASFLARDGQGQCLHIFWGIEKETIKMRGSSLGDVNHGHKYIKQRHKLTFHDGFIIQSRPSKHTQTACNPTTDYPPPSSSPCLPSFPPRRMRYADWDINSSFTRSFIHLSLPQR